MPGTTRRGACLDGHLRLQPRVSLSGAGGGRAEPGVRARFRQEHHPGRIEAQPCSPIRSTTCEPGAELLARRRHVDAFYEANLELICTCSPELNLYDEQLADLDLPGAAAAGQVRAGRPESPRCRGQLHGRRRLHRVRCDGARVAAVLERSRSRGTRLFRTVVLPRASIGGDCRISSAIIDEDCVIPDGTVIGENAEDDARRFVRTDGGVVLVCPHMLQ
jgi:hypothetical protein